MIIRGQHTLSVAQAQKILEWHKTKSISLATDILDELYRQLNVEAEATVHKNALYCRNCGETIESKSRHDFVACKCGNFTDGGTEYSRKGGNFDEMVPMDEFEVK